MTISLVLWALSYSLIVVVCLEIGHYSTSDSKIRIDKEHAKVMKSQKELKPKIKLDTMCSKPHTLVDDEHIPLPFYCKQNALKT